MKAKVAWFVVNSAWWGLAVADIIGGHGWAGNVFTFVTLALTAVTLFVAFVATFIGAGAGLGDIDADDIPERQIPAAWSWAYDIAGILFIAGAGWFWLATAVFVQASAQHWTWSCMEAARQHVEAA